MTLTIAHHKNWSFIELTSPFDFTGQNWLFQWMDQCGDENWGLLRQQILRTEGGTAGVRFFHFHQPQCIGGGVAFRGITPMQITV